MRLGDKMRVFRVTDYEMQIWFDRWRFALPLLFDLGEEMEHTDLRLGLTQFDSRPFIWQLPRVKETLDNLVQTFLEVRGNSDTDSFEAVFDTKVGIDLLAVIRLLPDKTIQMSLADIRFNMEHTKVNGAPLDYMRLSSLFCNLIAIAQPEHATVTSYPPITETWYEDIRVNVDLTKVPISIQWFNYFDDEWVERLGGEERIRNAPVGDVIEMPSGLVFIMQHEPFTYNNPEHVTRQRELDNYFRLSELHKQYPSPR